MSRTNRTFRKLTAWKKFAARCGFTISRQGPFWTAKNSLKGIVGCFDDRGQAIGFICTSK